MAGSDSDKTPANPEVLKKYQTAADISNRALRHAISLIKADSLIIDICRAVDAEIAKMASEVYVKEKLAKGVAFPTSISVNNVLCHFSPLEIDDEANKACLKNGNLVKIELGAHVDGFPALVCHSCVVGATASKPTTGIAADLLQAAHLSAEAALRKLQTGKSNNEFSKPLLAIASEFGVKSIEGIISHDIAKDKLAGLNMIVFNPSEQQRKALETFKFEPYQVYVIDVAVSSGEGKVKPGAARTTIYKRNDTTYLLKLKTSRAVFTELNAKFGTMAFNMRDLNDQRKARVALVECTNHGLVSPYEVLYEKEDALTARFMFTAIVLPSGPLRITESAFDQQLVKSEKALKTPELIELVSSQAHPPKKEASDLAAAEKVIA